MGGGGHTSGIIKQNHFTEGMIKSLNHLHGPPLEITKDPSVNMQALQRRLKEYTKRLFDRQHSYTYQRDESSPRDCADLNKVHGADELVNCSADDRESIQRYIERELVPSTTLPEKFHRKAANQLATKVGYLIDTDTDGWQDKQFRYRVQDPDWTIDATFVYDVVDVPGSSTNPSMQRYLVLSYVGVTYPTGPAS